MEPTTVGVMSLRPDRSCGIGELVTTIERASMQAQVRLVLKRAIFWDLI
jgi:hypothetical protein